jgi:hypothetical protein
MEDRNITWLAPLSGDVMQAINPWSWWTNAMGQFGLVNISAAASANPRLEREITGTVASYGRQLGRISEALYAVLAHADQSAWSAAERREVADFRRMADEIAAVKERHAAPTDHALDELIDGIRFLKERNAAEYERVVGKLRRALLAGNSKAPEPARRAAAKPRPGRRA